MAGIGWAVNVMSSGRKVKREKWHEDLYLFIKDGQILESEGVEHSDQPWTNIKAEDVLAQDWVTARPAEIKPTDYVPMPVSEFK